MCGRTYIRCGRTYTVNVEIFAQDIFSCILRRALDARKFDVSENYNHNRTNRNNQHMRETLTAQICLIGLDARKFSCAKISTFTVFNILLIHTQDKFSKLVLSTFGNSLQGTRTLSTQIFKIFR